MQRYWERAAVNLEAKDSEIRREVDAQTTMPVTIPESDQTQPMRGE
jgi:hypothetical protein